MAEATEIVYLYAKEGLSPLDTSTQEGKLIQGALETIVDKGRCQRLYVAQAVETPSLYLNLADWTTIEEHVKFTKWEGYSPFVGNLLSVLDKPPTIIHAHMTPHPPKAAYANVTEFITIYFPTDYSAEDQKTVHDNMIKFGTIVKDAWEGCRGTAAGWAVEEVDLPDGSGKARAYVAFIGWDSVESHLQYRETQSFKDNVYLLRGSKDLKEVKVFHFAAKEFRP